MLMVIGTWLLVIGTLGAVVFQVAYMRRALNADTFSRMTNRWDAPAMRGRRKRLATELRAEKLMAVAPASIDEVLDFFEDLGTVLREGWLPIRSVWQSFSTDARHYWAACGQYVTDKRNEYQDQTYFSEFDYLVQRLTKEEASRRNTTKEKVAITSKMCDDFLQQESLLEES